MPSNSLVTSLIDGMMLVARGAASQPYIALEKVMKRQESERDFLDPPYFFPWEGISFRNQRLFLNKKKRTFQ